MRLLKPKITWQTIKKDLESKLNLARSDQDFTDLVEDLGGIVKNYDLDAQDRTDVRNFRQKIYDRKKKSVQDLDLFDQESVQELMSNHQDFTDLIKNLDLRDILKKSFSFSVYLICTLLTSWFIWKQSIPLYEAVGFPEPVFCSIGAIVMIIGFSAIYSLKKSKLVLMLCIYMSIYEMILIVKGTYTDDHLSFNDKIEASAELKFSQEKVTHAQDLYQTSKASYDNPSSKVFHNSWYKEKFVTPYWGAYELAQTEMSKKRRELNETSGISKNESMLKILFRLGLIFLCMISSHNLLKIFTDFMDHKISKNSQTHR